MNYAFVGSNHIKGYGENIHIFEVQRNGRGEFEGLSSRCGNVSLLNGWNAIEICENESKARSTAVNLQNSGKNVCGICVATFYAPIPTPRIRTI